MKKLYILTVLLIIVITATFLLFFTDENTLAREFLSSYGIKIKSSPSLSEEFIIPKEFDSSYTSYNILQIESGLDLSFYAGKKAVRKTYLITNFPEETEADVFANVIFVNRHPVAGDINCPALSGFILPLSYMLQK